MQHVLDILEIINKEPNLSQKKIAERSGISTGKVNYIINDLTKKNYVVSEKNGKHISYYVKEQGLKFLQSELATLQKKRFVFISESIKKLSKQLFLRQEIVRN